MSPNKFSKDNLRQIEGRNPVLELLKSKALVVKVALEEQIRHDERIKEIHNLVRGKQIETERLRRKTLDKISKTGIHQGVIAWAEWPEEISTKLALETVKKDGKDPFFIILPSVTYEQNLGAVIRTAETAGVDAVIVGNRALGLSPVVSRVAMGAAEHVPLIHENIFSTIKYLHNEGIKLIAADANASKNIYQTDLTGPIALVIGDEHKGVSQTMKNKVDLRVKIPMFGKISSLNLSVAAGILMFETVRQRHFLS